MVYKVYYLTTEEGKKPRYKMRAQFHSLTDAALFALNIGAGARICYRGKKVIWDLIKDQGELSKLSQGFSLQTQAVLIAGRANDRIYKYLHGVPLDAVITGAHPEGRHHDIGALRDAVKRMVEKGEV